MQKRAGTFIVIEGTDGSGKATQFELLCDRLRQAGYDVAAFDFPQYDSPSSYFVKQYLNGEYGSADAVGPYTASLFYALDRYEAAPKIREALEQGKIIVSNRYTGSSMGHQGTKFKSPEERRGYFIWLDNLEFEMLQIPRPDISFVLRVPADIASSLIDKKGQRTYTDKKRDIHEANLAHLERSVEVYDDLAQLFPKDFQRIDCVRGAKLLPADVVQNMLWEKVAPLLPPPPQLELTNKDIPSAAPAAVQSSGPTISEPAVKPAETARIADSAPEDPLASASGPAEPDDQSQTSPKNAAFGFREVIGQHFTLEPASQLLAQQLATGRSAVYVHDVPGAIDYTQKDQNGNYRYYTPGVLSALTAQQYHASMDRLFDLYGKLVAGLTTHFVEQSDTPKKSRDDAWLENIRVHARMEAHAALPVAATGKVIVLTFGPALEQLVTQLLASNLPELRSAGGTLLYEARSLSPTFLEGAEDQDASSPVAYRRSAEAAAQAMTSGYLPEHYAAEAAPVHLAEAWPRNELDILPDIAYPYSSLPFTDLRAEIAAWPYNRKLDLIESYLGSRKHRQQQPGSALEKLQYTWDITSSYAVFRELQRLQLIENAVAQPLTPRYGYAMPQAIEDAGLTDLFEQSFDLSLELYSFLQTAEHPLEAQYAVLQGHKLRWKATQGAAAALRLQEAPASNDARILQRAMHDKLAEVHPLIADSISFAPTD
ncbi:MAG TPA: hypothetical protein VF466_03605 [Candidatus Saccharimonadales bacterium]